MTYGNPAYPQWSRWDDGDEPDEVAREPMVGDHLIVELPDDDDEGIVTQVSGMVVTLEHQRTYDLDALEHWEYAP